MDFFPPSEFLNQDVFFQKKERIGNFRYGNCLEFGIVTKTMLSLSELLANSEKRTLARFVFIPKAHNIFLSALLLKKLPIAFLIASSQHGDRGCLETLMGSQRMGDG